MRQVADLKDLTTDGGESPLWLAAGRGLEEMVRVLLTAGADVDAAHPTVGATPLWIAIYRRRWEVAELLLEEGQARGDLPSADGVTPSLLAYTRGRNDIFIRMTMAASSSEDLTEWDRKVFTRCMILFQQIEVVREMDVGLLLDFHAPCDGSSGLHLKGDTALHVAVASDSLEMVQVVAERTGEALLRKKNARGQTATALAWRRGAVDVVKYLRSQECRHWDASVEDYGQVDDCISSSTGASIHNSISSLSMRFPLFSDHFRDLSQDLVGAQSWLQKVTVDADDVVSMSEMQKFFVPQANLRWPHLEDGDDGGGRQSEGELEFASLRELDLHLSRRVPLPDLPATRVVRTTLGFLQRLEAQLSRTSRLMKQLDVAFVPVGSMVEGSKIGLPNELDVMVLFRGLHGLLRYSSTDMRRPLIFDRTNEEVKKLMGSLPLVFDKDILKRLEREESESLSSIILGRRMALNVKELFLRFVAAVGEAVAALKDEDDVPEQIWLNRRWSPCCEEESGRPYVVYKQCRHQRPPAVSFTRSGAVVSFLWKEEPYENMLFTVDLVPSLLTLLGEGRDQFALRHNLVSYLLEENSSSWMTYLTKYLRDDRMYLSHFENRKVKDRKSFLIGVKMINWRGHMILRPGTDIDVKKIFRDPRILEAYRILKFIRALSGSPAKSYTIKKVLSDVLKQSNHLFPSGEASGQQQHHHNKKKICSFGSIRRRDSGEKVAKDFMRWRETYELVEKVLQSDELEGQLSSGIAGCLSGVYAAVDVRDLPAKGAGVHLVRTWTMKLHEALKGGHEEMAEKLDLRKILSRERR